MTSPATQEPCPMCGGSKYKYDKDRRTLIPCDSCNCTSPAPPSQRAELLTQELESAMVKLRESASLGRLRTLPDIVPAEAAALLQHIAALTQRVEAAERMAEGIETTDRLRIANAYGYVTDKVSDAILSLRGLSNAYRALSQEPRDG